MCSRADEYKRHTHVNEKNSTDTHSVPGTTVVLLKFFTLKNCIGVSVRLCSPLAWS